MTKEFWKTLFFKTAKTWCQAFVGVIGIDCTGKTLADVDWMFALSGATLAAIVCFFWNLAIGLSKGLPEVEYAQHQYMSVEEPEDSYIDDDFEVFDNNEEAADGEE